MGGAGHLGPDTMFSATVGKCGEWVQAAHPRATVAQDQDAEQEQHRPEELRGFGHFITFPTVRLVISEFNPDAFCLARRTLSGTGTAVELYPT
jgi:hypothetical protein